MICFWVWKTIKLSVYADKSLQLKTFGDFYEPGRKLYATDDNMKDLVRKPLEHSHKTVWPGLIKTLNLESAIYNELKVHKHFYYTGAEISFE